MKPFDAPKYSCVMTAEVSPGSGEMLKVKTKLDGEKFGGGQIFLKHGSMGKLSPVSLGFSLLLYISVA
jgi:hypothetical protein